MTDPQSLPSWERGLKLTNIYPKSFSGRVAPLAGARGLNCIFATVSALIAATLFFQEADREFAMQILFYHRIRVSKGF